MPWDEKDAVSKTRYAKGREKQWSRKANAVLRETGDDALAIKVANKSVHPKRGGK